MDDHDFMVEISLASEGISEGNRYLPASPEEMQEYRQRMAMFADQSLNAGETESECPKYAFIAQDDETGRRLGLIMFLLPSGYE